MSNIKKLSITGLAASANNIALAQTKGSAGTLTLNGALVSGGVATLAPAGRVSFASTGNISTVIFTVTGTDRNGYAQTATVTGVNNNAVATTVDFLTITSIANSAAVGTNVTVGTNAVASTAWYPADYKRNGTVLIYVTLSTGASLTYTVEMTPTNLNDQTLPIADQIAQAQTAVAFSSSDTTVVAASTNEVSNFITAPAGIRLTLNSYTSGTATITIVTGNTHTI